MTCCSPSSTHRRVEYDVVVGDCPASKTRHTIVLVQGWLEVMPPSLPLQGWLDITYLDDTHRVGRDDKGNLFYLERVDVEKTSS